MTIAPQARISAASIEALERQSQTYAEYAAGLGLLGIKLSENWSAVKFDESEMQTIASIDEPLRIFALVEARCPDVVANLPILARVVELNPLLSLFVLHRPDYPDFAASYPGPTISESKIPTYVVIDAENRERSILLERPPEITKIMTPGIERIYSEISARFPAAKPTDIPAEALADLVKELLPNDERDRSALSELERKGIVSWLVQSTHDNQSEI